jgi:hypothetical protein
MPAPADTTAVLLLVDSASAGWAIWRLVRGARPLRGTPGLRWARVLGSGSGGGFTLKPSATRGGLFCAFDSAAAAAGFLLDSPTLDEYRDHASELCAITLRPYSSRGRWGGQDLPPSERPPADGPVAALTRASIRATRALDFWRHAPPAQREVETAPGCRLAVGLGEAPLLRQATLSLWDSVQAMDAYARGGAHQQAIVASQRGRHFSESMFVRFVPVAVRGIWKGHRLG